MAYTNPRGITPAVQLAHPRRTLVERMRAGDLRVPGQPAERADNLLLLGDPALQLLPDEAPASAPRFILHPVPHNQPMPFAVTSGFVGRADALVRLAAWLSQPGCRAFAISGVGGIGKTALVLQAALRQAYRFHALAFASAKDTPDFGALQVLQALNGALGLTTSADDAANLPGAIAQRLNNQAVLLILDNLERLTPTHSAALAHALAGLDPRNGSRVLMTLRPQEHDPLTMLVEGRDRLVLGDLDRPAALRLAWDAAQRQELALERLPVPPAQEVHQATLRQRAGLPGIVLLGEVAALADLAERAFHHPTLLKFAVALAAEDGWEAARRAVARLRGQALEQMVEALIGQMLDRLCTHTPTALATLQAMLVFSGGTTAERLGVVATGQPHPLGSDTADDFRDGVLRPCVRANLLLRTGERYDLAAPVRAYLQQRRPPAHEAAHGARLRHAEAHRAVVADYDAAIAAGRMTYSAPLEWSNVRPLSMAGGARPPPTRSAPSSAPTVCGDGAIPATAELPGRRGSAYEGTSPRVTQWPVAAALGRGMWNKNAARETGTNPAFHGHTKLDLNTRRLCVPTMRPTCGLPALHDLAQASQRLTSISTGGYLTGYTSNACGRTPPLGGTQIGAHARGWFQMSEDGAHARGWFQWL